MKRVMQMAQQRPSIKATIGRPIWALTPQAQTYRRRCKSLPPIQAGEVERLVAGFLAARAITACPTRYAAPVEQRPQLSQRES
jgi:hypothetical protein